MGSPVPLALRELIVVNREFGLVVCRPCHRVISTTSLMRHLREQHRISDTVRSTVDEFLSGWSSPSTGDEIAVPIDGLPPQRYLHVMGGRQCLLCRFLCLGRVTMRKHCNQVHQQFRQPDRDLFRSVEVQS